MEVDLFTWGAQIVNFLILVFLLKHLLYGRVIDAMDERQQRIRSHWDEAKQEKDKASEKVRKYESKSADFEQERQQLLEEARREAEDQKKQYLKEARRDVEDKRDQWRAALEEERSTFIAEMRQAAGKQVLNILRQALQSLADAHLEEQAVEHFIERIDAEEEQKDQVQRFIQDGDKALTVRTSFDLSQQQREQLQEVMDKLADGEVRIEFETAEDLLCGVELRSNGQKVGWSLQEYLSRFDESLTERVQNQTQRTGQDSRSQQDGPSANSRSDEKQTRQQNNTNG